MKIKWLAVIVTAVSISPALAIDRQSYIQFSQTATTLEHQNKWKNINWLSDFDAAQRRACKEDKPLMIFMVVQHRGNTSATDC